MSNLDQPLSVQADNARSQLRCSVYWILIVTSAGVMVGRVWSATILQSANDRSRWCTIRALVDDGTYQIDQIIFDEVGNRTAWFTIDRVKHKGTDGREHSYSSKPTLLPTFLAGQYWIIKKATGADLEQRPNYVGRWVLLLGNVMPLFVFLILLANVVERYGVTDWGRVFVVGCGAFGTFLTTFAVTVNNHVPAAVSVMISVHALLAVWRDGDRRWWRFALAGFFSAFAVANELPALAFACALLLALVLKSPLRTLLVFVPAAAIVMGGNFYSNYLAHGTWIPAYVHRQDGAELFQLDATAASELNKGEVPREIQGQIDRLPQLHISPVAHVSDALPPDASPPAWKVWAPREKPILQRWRILDPTTHDRLAVVQREGEDVLRVHLSDDNWYDYEDSYWTGVTVEYDEDGRRVLIPHKSEIDMGEKSLGLYAFNALIGHHGLFSLTPIWLLAVVGIALMMAGRPRRMRGLALMVLAVSLACLAFYLLRPIKDRNYGGVSCGMRWLFWLAPLWLLCVLPAADAMASSRTGKRFGLLLLLVSVASASYALLNPWSHSWIYDYWKSLDWHGMLHSRS